MKSQMAELRKAIEKMSDPEDRRIPMAMLVLLSALEVTPNVDRLTDYTGYLRDFVSGIYQRMRQAGLWTSDLIDTFEWEGKPEGIGLYTHALVALGLVRRETTPTGVRYVSPNTGELLREWNDPQYAVYLRTLAPVLDDPERAARQRNGYSSPRFVDGVGTGRGRLRT